MQLDRDQAINRIKSERGNFQKARNKQEKIDAADDFKVALMALTRALKHEQNQTVRETLKQKLPELESELIKMRQEIKKIGDMSTIKPSDNAKAVKTEEDKEKGKMQNALSEAIVKEKPNVQWDDIAGLKAAKQGLQEAVILPIKFPQIFVGLRTPWRGILLYGPPGTGKTYLAKACATEMEGGTFFSVSSSDLMSKFVGESEKLIKTLFKMARDEKPSIIFIDEVDSMAGNRTDGENEASRRVKTEFLVQMQGVGNDSTGVLVLGATNLPWALDPAIRRRFERRIYIPLPETNARLYLLNRLIGANPNEMNEQQIEDLAERCQGFSGADISILVRAAMYQPLKACQLSNRFERVFEDGKEKWMPVENGHNNPQSQYRSGSMHDLPPGSLKLASLNYAHFLAAIKNCKPSVNNEDLLKYIEFTKEFGQDG